MKKTLFLLAKAVCLLIIVGVVITIGDNFFTYMTRGGMKGSVASIIFAAVGHVVALALCLVGALFIIKQKDIT